MLFIAQLQAERLAGTLTPPPTDQEVADRPADVAADRRATGSRGVRTHEDVRSAS